MSEVNFEDSLATYDFGVALEFMESGYPMSRLEWINTDTRFVFKQVPSAFHSSVVPKMQSVPNRVKKVFQAIFDDPDEQIDALYYSNQFAVVKKSNVIDGYGFTPQDVMASDWYIYEHQNVGSL